MPIAWYANRYQPPSAAEAPWLVAIEGSQATMM